jgi:hypothetical protein
VLACDPTPTVEAKPAPRATRFRQLSKPERADAVAAIVAALPAELAPKVEVDFAGYPHDVTLTLPAPVAEADRVARALGFLREHARLFGIVDATTLPYQLDGTFIRVGEGERWTGQIVVEFRDREMSIFDHLWPIATEQVARPAAELEALVKPYYGLHGEFRSKCLEKCGHHDSSFVLGKSDFSFRPGMALVCTPEGVVVRAAFAIRRHYRPGSSVPGIEKLPQLVDARTLAPITGNFYMPNNGSVVAGVVAIEAQVGFDSYGACFDEK